MDRTTATAAVKVLERRGLIDVEPDPDDRRNRRLRLSNDGIDLLKQAVPIWRETHDALDAVLGEVDQDALKSGLSAVARS